MRDVGETPFFFQIYILVPEVQIKDLSINAIRRCNAWHLCTDVFFVLHEQQCTFRRLQKMYQKNAPKYCSKEMFPKNVPIKCTQKLFQINVHNKCVKKMC